MKQFALRTLCIATVLFFTVTSCGTSSSLLGAGSPLLTALGGNANLSSLASILQTPGLDKILGSSLKDPFTLLAPTNDALSALGSSALSDLTKPENLSALGDVLNKHLLKGQLNTSQLSNAANSAMTTLGGSKLDLSGVNMGSLISGDGFNVIPIDKVLK
jgi:uncharacterized surface protein with fasciclin (FAS1) repeats